MMIEKLEDEIGHLENEIPEAKKELGAAWKRSRKGIQSIRRKNRLHSMSN